MSNAFYVYHCSQEGGLATRQLENRNGRDIRGICFSDDAQTEYGPHVYRTEIPSSHSLLTSDMFWQIAISAEGSIEYPVNRDGEEISITKQDVRAACRQAMATLDMDPELFPAVYSCAIKQASCSEDEELEEAGINGWDLQSVRALTAHNLGLWGAEIEDDTGLAYITANTDLALDKVASDDEGEQDESALDPNGFYVVQASCKPPRPSVVATQDQDYGMAL
jgi:hypothetical protein